MGRLLRELNDLIEKEISLYNKFILLLKEQWGSISNYSLDSLQEIIAKKEIMVQQMQQLEKERSRLMENIARLRGVPEKGLTLKKIIQTSVNPIRVKLGKSRETLLSQISTINELHEGIKALMDRSSLSMKKSLVFVHSKSEEANAPYHPNGKLGEANLQGRMLNFNA
jgi:flagellar biosynthesis/type III secretory pathway chaperone